MASAVFIGTQIGQIERISKNLFKVFSPDPFSIAEGYVYVIQEDSSGSKLARSPADKTLLFNLLLPPFQRCQAKLLFEYFAKVARIAKSAGH